MVCCYISEQDGVECVIAINLFEIWSKSGNTVACIDHVGYLCEDGENYVYYSTGVENDKSKI